jgi:predicted transcriptional regulator of viral defense system
LERLHLPGVMQLSDGSADRLIAEIASRSHGVVTRKTLLGKGMTHQQIRSRLRRGSLHREHPGVYRVGHQAPSFEARYLAAVLACGQGALLIARPAAFLWGLVKGSPPRPDVIALVKRRVKGVITHRVNRIDVEDATTCRRIPVTAVPRTLVDLAGSCQRSPWRGHVTRRRSFTTRLLIRWRKSWRVSRHGAAPGSFAGSCTGRRT